MVSPPIVTVPFTNQTAGVSGGIILGVGAEGSAPLDYHWFLNGTNLVAHGTSWIELSNLSWSQSGYYTVVVSNPWGSVTNRALLSLNDLRMYAGIRIAGAPGVSYQIDTQNSLNASDPWLTLTNLTLPFSPYLFIDEDSPNYPQRFYRVTAQQ